MIRANEPADPEIHADAAEAVAKNRYTVQACLREEEWGLAELEFYLSIREVLERRKAKGGYTYAVQKKAEA